MGKQMAGTNEFAFFRCKSICTGGGPESGRKKFEKCLPAGTGTKIYFSSHSAQQMKHINAQKISLNSSPNSSTRVIKTSRRNFALGRSGVKTSLKRCRAIWGIFRDRNIT